MERVVGSAQDDTLIGSAGAEALSGESDDTLYIEFSADEKASPTDHRQWSKANPSYPTRTGEASMLRMKKNLTPDSFLREGLGVWGQPLTLPRAPQPIARWRCSPCRTASA